MLHLDLFSGIGGFALACQWAGIETIGFVEIDKYCQKVLGKHWPNVSIVEDIRDVEKIKEIVTNAISYLKAGTTLKASDFNCTSKDKQIVANATREGLQDRRGASLAVSGGTQPEPKRCHSSPSRVQGISGARNRWLEPSAILITAGFPCQPFSVAGKQLSQGDDRYLWPQTLAVIKAIKPQWVLLENVTGIINLALDTVLSDLEGAGYSYETLVIPACAVNAWHRRDRVWIVGYSQCNGWNQRIRDLGRGRRDYIQQDRQPQAQGENWQRFWHETPSNGWWAVEPRLGRVAHGIPNRVDRLKCLGNAIVPQVAYEIIKVIIKVEQEVMEIA